MFLYIINLNPLSSPANKSPKIILTTWSIYITTHKTDHLVNIFEKSFYPHLPFPLIPQISFARFPYISLQILICHNHSTIPPSAVFICSMMASNRFCACSFRSARYVHNSLVSIKALHLAGWTSLKYSRCIIISRFENLYLCINYIDSINYTDSLPAEIKSGYRHKKN